MRRTGDIERKAADAVRPIVERLLQDLALGPDRAEILVRQIAEAYMTGRAHGINLVPHKANTALSAEGIAIAFAIEYGLGPRLVLRLAPDPGA